MAAVTDMVRADTEASWAGRGGEREAVSGYTGYIRLYTQGSRLPVHWAPPGLAAGQVLASPTISSSPARLRSLAFKGHLSI